MSNYGWSLHNLPYRMEKLPSFVTIAPFTANWAVSCLTDSPGIIQPCEICLEMANFCMNLPILVPWTQFCPLHCIWKFSLFQFPWRNNIFRAEFAPKWLFSVLLPKYFKRTEQKCVLWLVLAPFALLGGKITVLCDSMALEQRIERIGQFLVQQPV